MPSTPTDVDASIPGLMRMARGSYAQAIRARLAAEGIDDLPRNGAFILTGLANGHESAVGMIRTLGLTKQAASQVIDTLALRGYVTREINPEDRRRMMVMLTDRGHAAAAAIFAGALAVDEELAQMITPAALAGLRAGLVALGRIKERMHENS